MLDKVPARTTLGGQVLKPCPHCGGTRIKGEGTGAQDERWYRIWCLDCNISYGHAACLEWWNGPRPVEDALRQEITGLEVLLQSSEVVHKQLLRVIANKDKTIVQLKEQLRHVHKSGGIVATTGEDTSGKETL